ncbi:hypothetical protein QYE76_038607 [Lolium multiflorum]|uniref:Uncharacterized protein n=1 Tax=Lolium multiflorum TaxID=4521 RepID=A0AAD8T9J6_LOLMU|nr:hypothetical protein QYE76_038607 [Lolium multiflorum]
MSTSNRIIKPGYESYQPVVAARQFGLGQVSPHFFLHFLTESRADLPMSSPVGGVTLSLMLDHPNSPQLSFTSSTDDFEAWWAMWKTHAFRRALGPLLKQLDAEYDIPAEQTDDTSSGEVKEVMMPSTILDLATSNSGAEKAATLATHSAEAREPIASSPAAPMVSGEVKGDRSSENRLAPRQLPLKADIADKCQRLNEKKAALDTKTDTSTSAAELEILRKELEDLEERVRVTKQLIQDKEALIARSHEEAEGIKAERRLIWTKSVP